MSDEQRARLRRLLFLEPLPFVSRVIFISTPHRGSYLASSFARRVAAKVMSLPGATMRATHDTNSWLRGTKVDRMLHGRLPTSLDSMSPKNPVLLALAEMPVTPPIKAHSIIPVTTEGDPQNGRDGVVAYRSAHVSYVESELVVRGKHSCQNLPVTIEEVRRILHAHLQGLPSWPSNSPSAGSPPTRTLDLQWGCAMHETAAALDSTAPPASAY